MSLIKTPVVRRDNHIKVAGLAVYTDDTKMEGMLQGVLVRSTRPHAKMTGIHYPDLPEHYFVVDAQDVPKENYLRNQEDGQRLFAEGEVNYVGEGIAMICGPDRRTARSLAGEVVVDYEDLPLTDTIETSTKVQVAYHYEKGEGLSVFDHAASVYEETFRTGYQEHMYLETNGMVADYQDGHLTITGSMQNPYYIHDYSSRVLGIPFQNIHVISAYTGGGFGGKEDYPSELACQAAVASMKTGHPVKVVLNRREDVADTPKRHPAKVTYRAALDENKTVIGLKVDLTLDGGAYTTVSAVVLQRSVITCTGVYNIPNLYVDGRCVMTNHVPSGAFRGFGAPQTHFAIETLMDHLAGLVGEDPLHFKMRHFVKQFDKTSTDGLFHYPVILDQLIDKAEELSSYREKREKYRSQTGRFRRGIGMSFSIHGMGFTGSAEKDFLKSEVKLHKRKDDKVEILTVNNEIGQGVKTAFCKIVAEAAGIPLDDVIYDQPDTAVCVNSGPTVASRSIMIPGKLLQRAGEQIRKEWQSGVENTVIKHYEHPSFMIPWDLEHFKGDPYPTYGWGCNVVEVELDTLTGEVRVVYGCGVYDVGIAIDERILAGQIQGGLMQGIGYGMMENMVYRNGFLQQGSLTDYMIPTSMDSAHFDTATVDNYYDCGPFGAKGAGELTLLGGAPAVVQAIEKASGCMFSNIPVTPEKIEEKMERRRGHG
ncbi:xanthine dehydrogenase family protein molybdopterin-binding subunit [Chordicoccus furentiruminis]|uniref:xanthine dehydrogenase family protein molybdopterin-binding subunit n=1 Tax=Chordicoccus furentiruminis TaxID=2709410 RepID=UPI0023A7FEB7|nr:xanthine dehydrogenase family protein molybdopterin-binding subunit [Chordicoccus furentiruminis]